MKRRGGHMQTLQIQQGNLQTQLESAQKDYDDNQSKENKAALDDVKDMLEKVLKELQQEIKKRKEVDEKIKTPIYSFKV